MIFSKYDMTLVEFYQSYHNTQIPIQRRSNQRRIFTFPLQTKFLQKHQFQFLLFYSPFIPLSLLLSYLHNTCITKHIIILFMTRSSAFPFTEFLVRHSCFQSYSIDLLIQVATIPTCPVLCV